jgi:hypothetical protein
MPTAQVTLEYRARWRGHEPDGYPHVHLVRGRTGSHRPRIRVKVMYLAQPPGGVARMTVPDCRQWRMFPGPRQALRNLHECGDRRRPHRRACRYHQRNWTEPYVESLMRQAMPQCIRHHRRYTHHFYRATRSSSGLPCAVEFGHSETVGPVSPGLAEVNWPARRMRFLTRDNLDRPEQPRRRIAFEKRGSRLVVVGECVVHHHVEPVLARLNAATDVE